MKKKFNLKMLASKIPLQYTYLSKALNDAKTHLSEDQVFRVSQILELDQEETDFLFLLRSRAITQDSKRKNTLDEKIASIRRAKEMPTEIQSHSSHALPSQMAYLLDPLCILLHASLMIPKIRQNPSLFCNSFGITHERYREILKKLVDAHFIELEEGSEKVTKILKSKIHFSPDHPLSRAHQNQLRSLIQTGLLKSPEENKTSLMYTFTADQKTQLKIRERIESLLKEIQLEVIPVKDEHVYQLSFDFFKWL